MRPVSFRRAPLGDPEGFGAPRDKTDRERIHGVRPTAGIDGIAGPPVEAWVHDRVLRAVRLCELQHAWRSDRYSIGSRAVARSSDCPDRPQRGDLWFSLNVTSCWYCVRLVLIISFLPVDS